MVNYGESPCLSSQIKISCLSARHPGKDILSAMFASLEAIFLSPGKMVGLVFMQFKI